MTSPHTLRTHRVGWATDSAFGTFEVDTYVSDDFESVVRNYLDEHVGTDARVTAVNRVG